MISLLFAVLLARHFTAPVYGLRQAFESVERLKRQGGNSPWRRHGFATDPGSGSAATTDHLRALVERQRRLLHDVPHELRASLARLQAAVNLMNRYPERSEELAARIEVDRERMDRLVDELLTLARLDAGITGNLSLSVDLNDLITGVAEEARIEAKTKRCKVAVAVPDILVMQGNPDLIRRAVENVARNALKHTAEKSQVAITVKVDGEPPCVYIDVTDEGKCLSEGDLKMIFEPFFRSANSDAFGGYGLGLAITRSVVEAHGGNVFAMNRPEGGLCVSMELPLAGRD